MCRWCGGQDRKSEVVARDQRVVVQGQGGGQQGYTNTYILCYFSVVLTVTCRCAEVCWSVRAPQLGRVAGEEGV